MRFLVDECTGPFVARWLREQQHDVFSVFDEAPGSTDDDILQRAVRDNWIIITNDKDFGDKVFREHQPHRGVILLRLWDERSEPKTQALQMLLDLHADQLADAFVVVTEQRVRFA